MELDPWTQSLVSAMNSVWTPIAGFIPRLFGALIVVLVGFGAFHRQVLAPQLRRWALRRSDIDDGREFVHRFRLSLIMEVVAGALLLAAVGVMKALPT